MLFGLATLYWPSHYPPQAFGLIAAALIGCALQICRQADLIHNWHVLILDSIAVALLLYASGPASPLLLLPFALILQGAVLAGSNGALAGSTAAAGILIGETLLLTPDARLLAIYLAAVALIGGPFIAWFCRQVGGALVQLHQQGRDKLTQELRALRQAQRWQRELLAVASCDTPDDLRQQVAGLAMAIAGAPARLEFGAESAPAGWSAPLLPGEEHSGRLVVERAVTQLQEEPLRVLAALAGLRAATLSGAQRAERVHSALAGLWDLAGLLDLPGQPDPDVLRTPCAHVASALGLDWIGLLAPNDRSPVAPVLVAYGQGVRAAALSPTQLRVAAEALRQEQPLVRREGRGTFACLPVLRSRRVPLVVAALGAAGDETAQLVLMLLGELLARRFERSSVGAL